MNIEQFGVGSPLVFFHGWGFDHRIWKSVAQNLMERFSVYLVDLPGFGHSPMMDWATFKTTLLNHIPGEFAVVGWSMGGLFASRMAFEAQERVSHLLNVAASPYFIKEENWPGIDPHVLDNFMIRLKNEPGQTRRDFIKLQARGLSIDDHTDVLSLDALQEGLTILKNWDLREALLGFNKPTCYMFGRLDAITPQKTMQVLQQQYPDFHYILFNKAAHMPFLSHQQEFIEHLEAFLA